MSAKLVGYVFDIDGLTATEKIVLLFLADSTNAQTQRCDPGWKRISTKCGLSRRGAQEIAARLIEKGYLERVERPGRTNSYIVIPEGVQHMHTPNKESCSLLHGGDAELVHGGDAAALHPNQNEPENNRAESSNDQEPGEHHHLLFEGRCKRSGCDYEYEGTGT